MMFYPPQNFQSYNYNIDQPMKVPWEETGSEPSGAKVSESKLIYIKDILIK